MDGGYGWGALDDPQPERPVLLDWAVTLDNAFIEIELVLLLWAALSFMLGAVYLVSSGALRAAGQPQPFVLVNGAASSSPLEQHHGGLAAARGSTIR